MTFESKINYKIPKSDIKLFAKNINLSKDEEKLLLKYSKTSSFINYAITDTVFTLLDKEEVNNEMVSFMSSAYKSLLKINFYEIVLFKQFFKEYFSDDNLVSDDSLEYLYEICDEIGRQDLILNKLIYLYKNEEYSEIGKEFIIILIDGFFRACFNFEDYFKDEIESEETNTKLDEYIDYVYDDLSNALDCMSNIDDEKIDFYHHHEFSNEEVVVSEYLFNNDLTYKVLLIKALDQYNKDMDLENILNLKISNKSLSLTDLVVLIKEIIIDFSNYEATDTQVDLEESTEIIYH